MESTVRLGLDEDFDWNCSSPQRVFSDSSSGEEQEDDTLKVKDKKHKKVANKKIKVENVEQFSILETFDPACPRYKELGTIDECERLVVSFPDSSKAWLLYIVFHLKQADVDKARSVGEKALETISFSKEKEKYNIWLTLLNVENLYGTQSSLMAVFDRAIVNNEPKDIYNHLVDLYMKSNKMEDAEELFEVMVKKFKQDRNIWIKFGSFYMKTGKLDAARKIMEESLKSVEKTFHPDVMVKFAHLEYKYGYPERGKTIFQNILCNYPKRQDFLCSYINELRNVNDVTELERVSSLLKTKRKRPD